MILSKAASLKILTPYEPALLTCVIGGWEDYAGHAYAPVRHVHSVRSRATNVHDHQVERARQALGGISGIRFLESNTVFFVVIDELVMIRFKKLDLDMLTRNYPTLHALRINSQSPMPNIPSLTRLVLGYVLNADETEIAAVALTCPNGRRNHWVHIFGAQATQLEFQQITDHLEPLDRGFRAKRVQVRDDADSDEVSNAESS